jgi:hypothetical protein
VWESGGARRGGVGMGNTCDTTSSAPSYSITGWVVAPPFREGCGLCDGCDRCDGKMCPPPRKVRLGNQRKFAITSVTSITH